MTCTVLHCGVAAGELWLVLTAVHCNVKRGSEIMCCEIRRTNVGRYWTAAADVSMCQAHVPAV